MTGLGTKLQKRCNTCKESRPIADYTFDSRNIDGLQGRCNDCKNRKRAGYVPPYDTQRNARLKYKYGITLDTYHQMVEDQGNRCLICERHGDVTRDGKLVVDHCHITGSVRGLLCHQCNVSLGLMNDNPDLLRQAATYLEES